MYYNKVEDFDYVGGHVKKIGWPKMNQELLKIRFKNLVP